MARPAAASPSGPRRTPTGGFRDSHFAALAAAEAGSFWFRARNRLILWALDTYAPDFGSLLEVGCGTGFVLAAVAASHPQARLVGGEARPAGLAQARTRLPGVEFVVLDARRIPFDGAFDVVAAFDVLEHIAQDTAALEQMHRALRPGGLLLVTVPQHRWLWSPLDDAACHARRYSAADLLAKTSAAGFRRVRSTSFVSLLLPFMALSRFAAGRDAGRRHGLPELSLPRWMDRLMDLVMASELLLIRLGVSLPAGGSLLVAARKPHPRDPAPGGV